MYQKSKFSNRFRINRRKGRCDIRVDKDIDLYTNGYYDKTRETLEYIDKCGYPYPEYDVTSSFFVGNLRDKVEWQMEREFCTSLGGCDRCGGYIFNKERSLCPRCNEDLNKTGKVSLRWLRTGIKDHFELSKVRLSNYY